MTFPGQMRKELSQQAVSTRVAELGGSMSPSVRLSSVSSAEPSVASLALRPLPNTQRHQKMPCFKNLLQQDFRISLNDVDQHVTLKGDVRVLGGSSPPYSNKLIDAMIQ